MNHRQSSHRPAQEDLGFPFSETALPGEGWRDRRDRACTLPEPLGRPWPSLRAQGPLHSPSNSLAPASPLGQREKSPARGIWPPAVCLICQFPFSGSQDVSSAPEGHKWIRYMLSFIREEGGSSCLGKAGGGGGLSNG